MDSQMAKPEGEVSLELVPNLDTELTSSGFSDPLAIALSAIAKLQAHGYSGYIPSEDAVSEVVSTPEMPQHVADTVVDIADYRERSAAEQPL